MKVIALTLVVLFAYHVALSQKITPTALPETPVVLNITSVNNTLNFEVRLFNGETSRSPHDGMDVSAVVTVVDTCEISHVVGYFTVFVGLNESRVINLSYTLPSCSCGIITGRVKAGTFGKCITEFDTCN